MAANRAENHRKRDLVGYGEKPPHPQWPNNARLALSIVISYEEGGERSIVNGDDQGETHLIDYVVFHPAPKGERFFESESLFEFGSRVGVWRLIRLLTERKLTATVWAVGSAVEKNPAPVQAMSKAGFEIASHQYRWIDYGTVPEAEERKHICRAVESIEHATGKRPVGFFHWCGPNTRRLVAEEGGFIYESGAYNDELPYWVEESGRPLLIVPYVLDSNDWRYSSLPSFATGGDFLEYCKDTFDQLYEEGKEAPKMMTLGLHPRLSGRPGRARALAKLLDYIVSHKDVWVCTRQQIAEHWKTVHPFRGP